MKATKLRSLSRAAITNQTTNTQAFKKRNNNVEKHISNKQKSKLVELIMNKKISMKGEIRDSSSTRNVRSITSHHAMLSAFGFRSKFQAGGQKPQL